MSTYRRPAFGASRSHHEIIDLAVRAFELPKTYGPNGLRRMWLRNVELLEIICFNWTLDGVSLVPEMREPFDLAAEEFKKKDSRGDRI